MNWLKILSEGLMIFLLSVCVFALLFVFTPARAQDGTITWTWTAPTTNEDGTPLTDLDGYTVHLGEESRLGRCPERPPSRTDNSCYPILIQNGDQDNPTATFTLTVPVTTTYYSSVVAWDQASNVSRWSNEVSFQVVIDSTPNVPNSLSVTCQFNAPNITCTAL